MQWIVGLGNPGAKYAQTPHNIGFDVVEHVARRWGFNWVLKTAWQAQVAEGQFAGKPVTLFKPLTYMNLSGEPLSKCLRQREWGRQEVMIVFDDVNLPIGRLRIRPQGSHGGQKGMRSIIEQLGGENIPRLRVGIAPTWPVEDLSTYVLGKLPKQQREELDIMIEDAAEALERWVGGGIEPAMDRFNALRRFGAKGPDGDEAST